MATNLERERALRDLIDRLIDDKLAVVLERLPALVAARLAADEPATPPGPGRRAIRRGVPLASVDQLRADFWPTRETVAEIEATIERWRHDDERA